MVIVILRLLFFFRQEETILRGQVQVWRPAGACLPPGVDHINAGQELVHFSLGWTVRKSREEHRFERRPTIPNSFLKPELIGYRAIARKPLLGQGHVHSMAEVPVASPQQKQNENQNNG